MKPRLLVAATALAFLVASASGAWAQSADTTRAATPQAGTNAPRSSDGGLGDKIYYGGSVTLSFGAATRFGVFPMLAYKLTPQASLGVEVGYEYLNYDNSGRSAHNYGGSVFGRYRLIPQLYAHAEFQMASYELFDRDGAGRRETVPFVLLGGGYAQQIGRRTWAYGEVVWDVLQDPQSPYDAGEPFITFGVGVGF